MPMKLYIRDTSAPCRSVCMVIEALNLKDVEYITVDTRKRQQFTEEYLKMNPQHTIPTLKDGHFVIWDSHAISTYLINKYAKDDSLYPKDPEKRAIVDQRLHFDNGILFNALRETMIPVIYNGEKTFRSESVAKIREGYDFLEKFLTGPWLAGDSLTVADICTAGNISSLNEILPIDKKEWPYLAAWFERCSKQDFYLKGNLPGLKSFQESLKTLLG